MMLSEEQKLIEAIVKGEIMPNPGIPESFNVLCTRMRGLVLILP